jgi:hypothetical protein
MSESPPPDSTASAALFDFRLLLVLFVGLRLTLAFVYQPFVSEVFDADGTPLVVEQGMTSQGDFRYFYALARLSDAGAWPYRDYWYEHPPVSSALFWGVYRLSGGAEYRIWAFAVGLILSGVDVGNLLLLREVGRQLHGPQTAAVLCWFYALLAAPIIFPWWDFEPLVAFTILLALAWLLRGRRDRSAVAAAVGVLTKYVPLLILPAVWRFYDRRAALRYTAITLVLSGGVFGLMIAWGGRMAVNSLVAQFHKASYQTIWALVDDNWRTGRFGTIEARYDPAAALEPQGNPARIPAGVRSVPFAAVGAFIFSRKLRRDDRGIMAFFTVTVLLFFLWAQGWSPQWVLILIPLILLNFPDRGGVLLCLLISLGSFVEYPVLFMRTAQTGGVISGNQVPAYVSLIVVRTALLIALVVALYRQLVGTGEVYA